MKNFNNKVAAITGAASGIGRALALNLAGQGCDLAISDINAAELDVTASQARKKGVKVTTQVLDVADRDAVHAWADQVVKDHGRVNMIFNNAGVAQSGSVEGTSYEDYDWIFDINFRGVLYGTKAFLPYLKKAKGGGHIINVSSVFGLFSQPGMSAYNATKFAVRGFTESLRQELDLKQENVSATCVHPGGIKTNIAKNARMSPDMAELLGRPNDADALRQEFADQLFRTTPESAAEQILKAVQHDERRVLVGTDAKAIDTMQRLLPTAYQRLVTFAIRRASKQPAKPHVKANG
ncbi:SDR family NAD(P)-dependent oxidoreductase [Marinobacteraceae bacterium S3BR75-40.1]